MRPSAFLTFAILLASSVLAGPLKQAKRADVALRQAQSASKRGFGSVACASARISDSNGKCCDPSSLSLPNGPDGRCACCPGSGDQCCGDSCFASTGDAFCCGGNVHQKGDYGGSAYASCCDYQSPFNSNTQYCCGGNVYDKSAYGGPGLAACCSDNQPYNPNIQFCCAGQAAKFSDYGGFGAARCCGDMDAYNSNYQSCCGSPSFGYGVGVGDSCCAIFPYSSATEKCCYGSQVVSIWQSC